MRKLDKEQIDEILHVFRFAIDEEVAHNQLADKTTEVVTEEYRSELEKL